jgi:hypothetical protein
MAISQQGARQRHLRRASLHIFEDTLDECIRKFMVLPEDQHHLYEIHTAPQSDLVSAFLSADR